MARLALSLLALMVVSGCATGPIPATRYPTYQSVGIVASPYVDDTYMPLGDHNIPQSQVYVAGFSGATTALGPVGGLFGHLVGTGIDQSRAHAAISEARDAMALQFHGMVADSLRKRTGAPTWKGPAVEVAGARDRAARIVVMPRARVFLIEPGNVRVAFQIDVYHALPDTTSRPSKRLEYHYYPAGQRALVGPGGWSDRGGAEFRETAAAGIDRLVEVFLADLSGSLQRDSESLKPLKWTPPGTTNLVQSVMVIEERGDYVVALPVVQERTLRNITMVLDRASLQ